MSMSKIVFIGDIHIKFSNLPEVDKLEHEVMLHCSSSKPTFFVLGGDILDTHERVNVQLLNRAYMLIKSLKKIAHVYVIVGNHDYINNQQFLSENHWMIGMKEWVGVTVVDTPVSVEEYIMAPYVPNGRLVEALDMLKGWKEAKCVFAHQEIRGCKMGAVVSEDGDAWRPDWPMLISGHIHERQNVGENVIYPGSSINHSYANDNQGVSEFSFDASGFSEFRIDLKLEKKRNIYRNIDAIDTEKILLLDKSCRLALGGEMKDIEGFKASQTYHALVKKGVKVVFQKKKSDSVDDVQDTTTLFSTILSALIKKEHDLNIEKDFQQIRQKIEDVPSRN